MIVRDATLDDVWGVLDDIRPADLREWYAATGQTFESAARETLGNTKDPFKVAVLEGRPLLFWGWNPEGLVWMFATETAEKYDLKLHRLLRPELAKVEEGKSKLEAYADARNLKHHVWLRWLGFEDVAEIPVHPFGLPFIHFVKELKPCAYRR